MRRSPPSSRPPRLRVLGSALALAAVAALLGAAAPRPVHAADALPAVDHRIKDPHYGDVLFEFFQDEYFPAITGLMVSQHFDRVAHHADEAEVLRGGLLLSYGMHKEAGAIFNQLIARGAAPPVRDRAWYYLARIRYQRGVPEEAEEALGRIDGVLPSPLEEDRQLLRAQVRMAHGDYAGAASVLDAMTDVPSGFFWNRGKPVNLFARYNLGVALIRSGGTERGNALLDQIGQMPAPDEETRTLRDRANVALGFTALQQGRPAEARRVLERVRLQGPQSNKALLGFGWAAAALKNPRQALVPWTELAGRDSSDAAVLEARIALPYAYAELGAGVKALALYQEALKTFDDEHRKLDESIAAIRAGKLVEGLLARNPRDDMGWFQNIQELPELPHAAHLTPVLAEHAFQEAFKNYRDLLFLGRNLAEWKEKIALYDDIIANRRQGYAERLPKVRERAQGLDIGGLARRRDTLEADLLAAQTRGDGEAFADANERRLLDRVAASRAALARLGPVPAGEAPAPPVRHRTVGEEVAGILNPGPSTPEPEPPPPPPAATADGPPSPLSPAELATAYDRLRRAAGALTWQLAQEAPARQWDAQKGLRTVAADLDESRHLDAALAQAQQEMPARFAAFADRLKALSLRLQALAPRLEATRTAQQEALQSLAVATLQTQQERLAGYTAQARLAVAQLYDHAPTPKDAENALTPR